MMPLRLSRKWLHWAHGPGAEDCQELALKLIAIADSPGPSRSVEITDPALVAEIVDVAELYHPAKLGDALCEMGPWWRAQPARIIREGRALLKRQASATKGSSAQQGVGDSCANPLEGSS